MSRPRRSARSKRLDLATLVLEVDGHRRAGRRVVVTNGCFDILHAGHLRLLEAAAAEGEVLVVAVNTDASVRRLKGDTRPVVGFEDRSLLLAGLEVVDHVVGFDEDTPQALLETLRPDVLVKGADWSAEAVVGRELVEGYGGRVVRVPLEPGLSSTAIVRKASAPPRSVDLR